MIKNKKFIMGILILLLVIIGVAYYIFMSEDSKTTLNLLEKQWIEKNKNNIVDFGITNNIPAFSHGGKGIFFDFLNSLEENTDLEFNKVSRQLNSDINSEYSFKIVDKTTANDLVIYEDNYVLVTNKNIKYNNVSEINNLIIGVLETDLGSINNYLNTGNNITLKTYKNSSDLFTDIKKEENGSAIINALILPKNIYLNEIISNNLYISYNITEMKKYYVLSLGNTERLNDILTKYYKKWAKDNYTFSYNNYFTNNYFEFLGIDDKEVVKFRSKRYAYGFVDNRPYDAIINDKLYGINSNIMKSFSKLANIEISFNQYDNFASLLNAFNENKIDFLFDNNTNNEYPMDVYDTVSVYNENVLILSSLQTDITINSLKSLENTEIIVLKDSQIANYLTEQKLLIKQYDNMKQLLKNINKNSIIAVDEVNYNYYKNENFKNFKIDYKFNLKNNYKFIVRDIKDNQLFINYFNFYLGFINEKSIINNAYIELIDLNDNPVMIDALIKYLALIIIGILSVLLVLKTKKEPKVNRMSKGNKLKYIDQLTSLKNRNYLNDNIEVWDNSEIYPQTIIVIDLNNVAYINDNYGHSEGDKVIREAANILIRNQVENSDIIRTNGNEFLLYLVGYDEKQIIAYMRKLSKDFKEISHGFGAALGYSIINDGIKTIDDAVNEATASMRENKEGFNN